MDTNQAIRLQCLELAVKAGTPWNRLTETADMLTAYVRGVSGTPRQNNTAVAYPADYAVAADKGVAVEEDETGTGIYTSPPEKTITRTPTGNLWPREIISADLTGGKSLFPPDCKTGSAAVEHERDWSSSRDITSWKPDPTSGSWKFPAYLGDPSYSKTLAAVEEEMAKGVPQEEIERRDELMRNGDFGKTAMLGSAMRATLPEDQRGEPVEEPPPGAAFIHYPPQEATSPPPGVIDDPRLPMVTM